MTIPQNVKDAIANVDACRLHTFDADWQTIRAHLLSQDAEIARLQAQLDAGTEAGWHALRNERDALQADLRDADERCALRSRERTEVVMRAEKAESRLAAADALLREMYQDMGRVIFAGNVHVDRWMAQIDAHLHGALSNA